MPINYFCVPCLYNNQDSAINSTSAAAVMLPHAHQTVQRKNREAEHVRRRIADQQPVIAVYQHNVVCG